jgi:hypothetical protein
VNYLTDRAGSRSGVDLGDVISMFVWVNVCYLSEVMGGGVIIGSGGSTTIGDERPA